MQPARKASALAKTLFALLALSSLALSACSTEPDATSASSGLEAELLGTWETRPTSSGSFARYVFKSGGKMHRSSFFSDTLEYDGTYLVQDSMLFIIMMVDDSPISELCLRIFDIGDSAFMNSGLLLEGGTGGLAGKWSSVSPVADDPGIPQISGLQFNPDGSLIVSAPTAVDTARYAVDGGIIRVTEFTVNRPSIDYGFAMRGNRLSLWELATTLSLFRVK